MAHDRRHHADWRLVGHGGYSSFYHRPSAFGAFSTASHSYTARSLDGVCGSSHFPLYGRIPHRLGYGEVSFTPSHRLANPQPLRLIAARVDAGPHEHHSSHLDVGVEYSDDAHHAADRHGHSRARGHAGL